MTPPEWQRDIMAQGELYCVGGSVRDDLMGLGSAREDEDYLVRGIEPADLLKILERHGRAVLVGKSFGVYKFRAHGERFDHDIAFPRREVSTGPGHRDFEVAHDHNLPVEEDLGRRDFTINAIARNVSNGSYVDPFDGRRDIADRILRMIFPKAFEEDPLRVLRGVRFAARFDLTIEDTTGRAMGESAGLLNTVSPERVQEELSKLLVQCENPSRGLDLLQKLGGLAVVLPELDRAVGVEQNVHHPDDVYWHSLRSCDRAPRANLLVRWAALLHDLGKVDAKKTVVEDGGEKVVFYGHEDVGAEITSTVLERLRFGTDFVRRCRHLVQHHMIRYDPEWNRSTVRRFIHRIGEENLDDMFALKAADVMSRDRVDKLGENNELRDRVRAEIEAEHALKVSDMKIDGRDVMDTLGIEPGERVGRILHEIFERVLEDPSLNDRARLMKILKEEFGTGA